MSWLLLANGTTPRPGGRQQCVRWRQQDNPWQRAARMTRPRHSAAFCLRRGVGLHAASLNTANVSIQAALMGLQGPAAGCRRRLAAALPPPPPCRRRGCIRSRSFPRPAYCPDTLAHVNMRPTQTFVIASSRITLLPSVAPADTPDHALPMRGCCGCGSQVAQTAVLAMGGRSNVRGDVKSHQNQAHGRQCRLCRSMLPACRAWAPAQGSRSRLGPAQFPRNRPSPLGATHSLTRLLCRALHHTDASGRRGGSAGAQRRQQVHHDGGGSRQGHGQAHGQGGRPGGGCMFKGRAAVHLRGVCPSPALDGGLESAQQDAGTPALPLHSAAECRLAAHSPQPAPGTHSAAGTDAAFCPAAPRLPAPAPRRWASRRRRRRFVPTAAPVAPGRRARTSC